jgi:hypothetical protein
VTIYITEQCRTFADGGAIIKQLRLVSALIADNPNERGRLRDFKPEAWREILYSGDVMYRCEGQPFRKINPEDY